jgi:hypothetical protein
VKQRKYSTLKCRDGLLSEIPASDYSLSYCHNIYKLQKARSKQNHYEEHKFSTELYTTDILIPVSSPNNMHVNLSGCKYSIYHVIWSTGKKIYIYVECDNFLRFYQFHFTMSAVLKKNCNGYGMCVRVLRHSGVKHSWRHNLARCVQNANTNTTTVLCTEFLIFCPILSKIVIRCLLVVDFLLKKM